MDTDNLQLPPEPDNSNIVTKNSNIVINLDLIPRGSVPLANAAYEAFVFAVFTGVIHSVAYIHHISQSANPKRAASGAFELLRRPEVRARLSYLKGQAHIRREPGKRLTLDKMRAIMDVIATDGSNTERMSAIKSLRDWELQVQADEQADKRRIADPAEISARLCRYAGRMRCATPERRAEDCREIIKIVCEMLSVTFSDLVSACRQPDAGRDSAPPLPAIVAKYLQLYVVDAIVL